MAEAVKYLEAKKFEKMIALKKPAVLVDDKDRLICEQTTVELSQRPNSIIIKTGNPQLSIPL